MTEARHTNNLPRSGTPRKLTTEHIKMKTKDKITAWTIGRFFHMAAVLPLRWVHILGTVLGWVVFFASPTYRRRCQENSQQAGCTPQEMRAAVAQSGQMVAELPKLWFGNTTHIQMTWDKASLQIVMQAYAAGKGIVFLTPHMGCFETIGQAWAQQFAALHGDFTVLFRPARKIYLQKWIANSRNRVGLTTVPTDLSGVRKMVKALRAGQAVGLLPDQVPPQGMGLWASFFGKSAYTMTLATKLALQTNATVLVGWGERLPHGMGYVIHCQPEPLVFSADLTVAVSQMNQALEAVIAQNPSQYLWGYGRYKIPRQNT